VQKPENVQLEHQEFWNRMEKNSLSVQQMPDWLRGSPVNKRTLNERPDQTAAIMKATAAAEP
jgi:hypothetical protein